MKINRITALTAVSLLLTLSACAQPVKSITATPPPSVQSITRATPSASGASVAKFGLSRLYDDGFAIRVSSATKFKIGRYAAGGTPGGDGVVLTIVFTNGTESPVDVTLTSVKLTYGTEGLIASPVFDAEAKIIAGFTGQIQAGRKQTAQYGFAVPAAQAGDLQVEVQTDPAHRASALFAGSAT